jgi:hypothetical protein
MRTGSGTVRTVARRLVLVLFVGTVVVIALLVGHVLLSMAGLTFDPHGYTVIFGTVIAVLLTPVAMLLWLVYQLLHDR